MKTFLEELLYACLIVGCVVALYWTLDVHVEGWRYWIAIFILLFYAEIYCRWTRARDAREKR